MNMVAPRSWLFVPGDDARKIGKALASPADAVIVDLEDAVAPPRKTEARALTRDVLGASDEQGVSRWVRINPLDSGLVEEDLAVLAGLPLAGLVLPKAEGGADIKRLCDAMDRAGLGGDLCVMAVATETAASLFHLGSYGGQKRLAGLTWGAEDLSSALGAASKYDADGALSFTYRMARSLCLAGAVAAGVQPIDGVWTDFRDIDGLVAETRAAAREGFTGKLAIHPAQVEPINAAFLPSEEERERARRIMAAFAEQGEAGAVSLDGRMLDRPHLVQAERLLARAAAYDGG